MKAPRCRARVQLGTKVPLHPDSGHYEVCLSASQWAKLFPDGQPGRKLGCGMFACAWERKPGSQEVVKITRDSDDVAGLLTLRGHPRVAAVREAYRLERSGKSLEPGSEGRSVPVYAIVTERLGSLPLDVGEMLDLIPTDKLQRDYHEAERRHRVKQFRASPEVRSDIDRVCVRQGQEWAETCSTFLHEVVDTQEDLARRGIVFLDTHAGNIGRDREGRWKILDLGNSLVPMRPPRITSLRGRLRVRRVR